MHRDSPFTRQEDFDAAVLAHDRALAGRGLAIWVGSEPTFTDRKAQSPEWLSQALGGGKEALARRVLTGLWRRFPGGLVLRSVGRQYPGETLPRWNLGLYRRRDGTALWDGPPDPLLAEAGSAAAVDLDAWAQALQVAFAAAGQALSQQATEDRETRCLSTNDGSLAFAISQDAAEGRATPRIDLPAFADVAAFTSALACVARACHECGLPALILGGQTPPVDATVELTTVTPDPAVIEINTAPSVDAVGFLWRSREIYAAAAAEGLSPYRLYFNGAVADSGGGGQITLGGPSPLDSPFVREPRLLPRLVRFFNRHPSLSYLFSHDHVGSSGQSARPDERGSDAFDELDLALALLDREPVLEMPLLWHSLAPFLCDAAGNGHRAEINVEKLWNPFLPGRGQLGLVEFRALRMQHGPERATALACLLRALVAMLAGSHVHLPLVDWGRELHQRFALPYYLEQDLQEVLHALDAAGLGLGVAIQEVLLRDEFRLAGQVALPGCTLEVRRALEFWPLLGDAASAEQGGTSRQIDASTARLELRLLPGPAPDPGWRDWQIVVGGIALPLRPQSDDRGEARVFGLRYRAFVPLRGLHPALVTQAPLQLRLQHPQQGDDRIVTLHEWHPAGEAYDGLPEDLAEAGRRRAERIECRTVPREDAPSTPAGPVEGLGPYCLDLRRRP